MTFWTGKKKYVSAGRISLQATKLVRESIQCFFKQRRMCDTYLSLYMTIVHCQNGKQVQSNVIFIAY